MPNVLSKPIFVVGAARSGTYLLASLIEQNFDVAYTGEANELWKRHTSASKYDLIPASAATSAVVRKTRAAFAQICREQSSGRLLEKTPANTLRLPFIKRIFPDARIVHIIRDGRDVAVSARKKYRGDQRKITQHSDEQHSLAQRLRMLSKTAYRKAGHKRTARPSLSDVPRYWNGALSMLGLKKSVMWGPRFPGYEAYYEAYSLLETAAIQWRVCLNAARNFAASPQGRDVCEVRYEDLLASPTVVLRDVFEFISRKESRAPKNIQHDVVSGGRTWRDTLTQNEIERLSVHIGHTLRSLEYEPPSGNGES